ncbi:MAG: hypothetical protein IH841_05910 [Thaumarchaeota archaeon]|nr:hypothetical protein [Nitrososphaerota archaeon]
MQKSFKHIIVDEENYQSLRNLGKSGESFNDVIKKLFMSKGYTEQDWINLNKNKEAVLKEIKEK